ncbi:MAG: hypothetical protein WC765_09410 [Phycisphaerae bacterium]|jgi:hypothetical protein|nr:hypothetical protein [Phycisphaerales bacterium]
MDRRQKKLVANIVVVIAFTAAMVAGFANVKNVINRSEAMRAMELLGKEVLSYRQTYGSLPSENYAKQFAEQIGAVRLGDFQYRAQWIEFGCDPNATILAYTEKKYSGVIKSGAAVLWLNGKTEWIDKQRFCEIMKSLQNKQELRWIQQHLQEDEKQH